MAKSKNNSMLDFLVTFFVEDRAISRMLSDVLKNRTNRLFLETLGLPSDFAIPFSQEEEKASVIYTLKQSFDDKYEVTLNGHPCNDHVIHSGDYFAFKNKSNGKTVKTLFIATSDIQAGYKKYALSKDTNIDLIIGNNKKKDLIHILEEHMGEKESAAESIEVIDIAHDQEYESLHVEQLKEHTRAYIKVQDGCNQFCSYCIIPYARGRVRSRKMEEVLEEITNLTKHGCQEFVITGIHVTSYGKDLGDVTLIDLLEEIAKIPEVKRIRLGSLEPGFITKDTLDRLSKMESFCPHFHLSLQSGCDSVLKRMNRKYTTQDIREKCKAIREHFQYPALTTDIIVGFPGETEEEFEETRKFLEEIDLYEMHVFKYSIRKGTKAADMKPQINDQIKAKRSNVLLEMSKQHQKEFETKQLGMVKEVLIEEKMHGKDHYYTGHTKEYIKVALYSEEPLENKIVKVKLRQILNDGYVLAEC